MSSNPYESPDLPSMAPPVETRTWTRMFLEYAAAIGVILIVIALLLPMRRSAPEAARRVQCMNNLKQIGLALQNYHDEYKSFPPAYTVDEQGKRLHSWRTLILPYIEQKPLYDKIDLSKPWDDPANKQAYETEIHAYKCPSCSHAENHTTYLAIVGPNCAFQGPKPISFGNMTDGTSNTLTVVDAASDHHVHWMSPHDVDEEWLLNIANLEKYQHPSRVLAAKADGSVIPLFKETKPEALRALMTINGDDHKALEDL